MNIFKKNDSLLWAGIVLYTGVIYSTVSIVPKVRKFLIGHFGPAIYDAVYWIIAVAGAGLLIYCFRRLRGRQLAVALVSLAIAGCVAAWYLVDMQYAVERVHFLEYGLLGALIYGVLDRRIKNPVSILFACILTYVIGLGDEVLQKLTPDRVAEVRDAITNLFSGALGIGVLWSGVYAYNPSRPVQNHHLRLLIASAGLTTVVTAMFLFCVQGFGYVVESKDAGRFYSSFTSEKLAALNTGTAMMNASEKAVYENEAVRHLFQREFYFFNNFAIAGGGSYRDYSCAWAENLVLERYYDRFLMEHGQEPAGPLCSRLDKKTGTDAADHTVAWPDSLRSEVMRLVGGPSGPVFVSRVKSTSITSFTTRDLVFYTLLILMVLGYTWISVQRRPATER